MEVMLIQSLDSDRLGVLSKYSGINIKNVIAAKIVVEEGGALQKKSYWVGSEVTRMTKGVLVNFVIRGANVSTSKPLCMS
jgi:hypothetical protein